VKTIKQLPGLTPTYRGERSDYPLAEIDHRLTAKER
jgi:hypothetical protein